MNVTVLADALAPVLRELVDATTAPLLLRLAALEKRLADDLPALIELRHDLKADLAEAVGRLPAGLDGIVRARVAELPPPESKEVDPALVQETVAAEVTKQVAALVPVAVDPEAMRSVAAAEAEKVAAALPQQIEAAARAAADALPRAPTAEEVAALVPPAPAGKSVTLDDLRPLVDEAVVTAVAGLPTAPTAAEVAALVPPPENGKSVDPETVAALVAAEVERQLAVRPPAPTAEEVAALVPKPKDGTNVSIDDVRSYLDAAVAGAFATIRVPRDGKDADPEVVAAMVAEAVKALPEPENGKDATPEQITVAVEKVLATWERPKDGASVTLEQIEPLVAAAVDKAMEVRPVAKDGSDGVGLAGAVIDRDGNLVVTLTDGATKNLGPVVGKDGDPGLNGLGFEDMQIVHDGERSFRFVLTRGDQVKEFAFTVPVVLDRGVFKDGSEYAPGDAVSFGGSLWIAQRATGDRPGTTDAFRLAVKKGRDGKDGEMPTPPKPVKLR